MLTLKVLKPIAVNKSRLLRKQGGNKKFQTFGLCPVCHCIFGPVDRLSRQFCSYECKSASQATGRKSLRRTTAKARSAQSLVRYHVLAGHMVRPKVCEECGAANRKIEAAHYDYDEPLRVRWLCRSCHVRWDKQQPKNGTELVATNENTPALAGVKEGNPN